MSIEETGTDMFAFKRLGEDEQPDWGFSTGVQTWEQIAEMRVRKAVALARELKLPCVDVDGVRYWIEFSGEKET